MCRLQTSQDLYLPLTGSDWLICSLQSQSVSTLTSCCEGILGCGGKVSKQTTCPTPPQVGRVRLDIMLVSWHEDVVCFLLSEVEMSPCSVSRTTKNSSNMCEVQTEQLFPKASFELNTAELAHVFLTCCKACSQTFRAGYIRYSGNIHFSILQLCLYLNDIGQNCNEFLSWPIQPN